VTVILIPSDNDRAALAEVLASNGHVADHDPMMSYADCVVTKPWGYEFELYDDHHNALWLLHINAARATSLHCHRRKTACFIPLCEGFQIVTLSGSIAVAMGQSIIAKPGVFHSVWNGTMSDGELIEIETPSIKRDLLRAQDAWGREKDGYEGEPYIARTNLDRFGHFRVRPDQPAVRMGHEIIVDQDGIKVRRLADAEGLLGGTT